MDKEETKKVFISQPMKGKSNSEIEKERSLAIKEIEKYFGGKPFTIIDSFFKDNPMKDTNPVAMLSESIKSLSTADYAYFTKDWHKARGCKIEHLICVSYNIPIIDGICKKNKSQEEIVEILKEEFIKTFGEPTYVTVDKLIDDINLFQVKDKVVVNLYIDQKGKITYYHKGTAKEYVDMESTYKDGNYYKNNKHYKGDK